MFGPTVITTVCPPFIIPRDIKSRYTKGNLTRFRWREGLPLGKRKDENQCEIQWKYTTLKRGMGYLSRLQGSTAAWSGTLSKDNKQVCISTIRPYRYILVTNKLHQVWYIPWATRYLVEFTVNDLGIHLNKFTWKNPEKRNNGNSNL